MLFGLIHLVGMPAFPQTTGRAVDRESMVPRWRLAHEGPFLEEKGPSRCPFSSKKLTVANQKTPAIPSGAVHTQPVIDCHTVQITFIFIGQTHLVFGKRVCTCATKHSNAFRTFLNWLKNSKRVWHQPKLHILRLPVFANFDL